jgi:hypothetical protein
MVGYTRRNFMVPAPRYDSVNRKVKREQVAA